jgi:hypothetical protein
MKIDDSLKLNKLEELEALLSKGMTQKPETSSWQERE